MFFESALVSTSLRGMLTVDERIIFLSILISVAKCNLNILALHVNYRVETVDGHSVFQQVLQSVARQNAPAVVHNRQSGVEICVVAEHCLHYIVAE